MGNIYDTANLIGAICILVISWIGVWLALTQPVNRPSVTRGLYIAAIGYLIVCMFMGNVIMYTAGFLLAVTALALSMIKR